MATVELTGVYRGEGRYGPTGAYYLDEATISRLGEVYQFTWRSGGHTWSGVGVVHGNVLAVAISSSSGNGVIALEIQQRPEGLVLQGSWAYASDFTLSSETLFRLKTPELPGLFGSFAKRAWSLN